MNIRSMLGTSIFGVGVLLFAAGCQSDIAKADMDAIGAWSTAECACAAKPAAQAKTCEAALKKPALEWNNSSGRPKYKLESLHAYTDIEGQGTACHLKIVSAH